MNSPAPALMNEKLAVTTPSSPASHSRRGNRQSYLLAGAVLFVAFCIRSALDPAVKDRMPFVSFFVATTFVAWYCGAGPAIMTCVGGWLLAVGGWRWIFGFQAIFGAVAAAAALGAALAGLVLTVALGMTGAWRILGLKPAEFLRAP